MIQAIYRETALRRQKQGDKTAEIAKTISTASMFLSGSYQLEDGESEDEDDSSCGQ